MDSFHLNRVLEGRGQKILKLSSVSLEWRKLIVELYLCEVLTLQTPTEMYFLDKTWTLNSGIYNIDWLFPQPIYWYHLP